MKELKVQNLPVELANLYNESSWKRGHQTFTTFKVMNGKILFKEDHIRRMVSAASFYLWNHIEESEIRKMFNSYDKLEQDHVVRFNLTEKYYWWEKRLNTAKDKILKTNFSRFETVKSAIPSNIKWPNYHLLDMELKEFKGDFFDLIKWSEHEGKKIILEFHQANIFVILKSGEILTPKIGPGVLPGILRLNLCKYFNNQKIKLTETNISISWLLDQLQKNEVEEVWTTNCSMGIRRIASLENFELSIKNTVLFSQVREGFGLWGEHFCE